MDIQVIPVSIATVLQQHPFILFYELNQKGTLYIICVVFSLNCQVNTGKQLTTLSLTSSSRLLGKAWLTDEVLEF